MFNSLDNQFSNQISTEFLDLIDIDFIQNNNDVNFTTRANSSEQEQQIASTPTTTEYYTFLPTEIYEIDENDNNNCRRFNPTNKKTHTFWPRENMYVENDNNESFYETNNIDLLERIKSIKKGGLFDTKQIQMMDTGTKETENNKSNEMVSLFEGSTENFSDEKLRDLDEFFLNMHNTNVNSYENFTNAQMSLNSSIDSGDLNFEKTSDLIEILNLDESSAKKQEVYNIKSSLMKRVENLNMKIEVKKTTITRQESFNFQMDDVQGLITPSIQFICHDPAVTNVCHDFLKSLPTPNINTSDLLNVDFQTPQISTLNQSYSNEINPFLKSMSAAVELNQKSKEQLNKLLIGDIEIQNQISVEAISLDHDYTSPMSKKRKNSINDDSNSNFDINEISNPVLTPTAKKAKTEVTVVKAAATITVKPTAGSLISTNGGKRKRVKGIYRANDVTSKEELDNYLERRRKNNISSKQSRLTKKTLYLSMDDKANQLERENEGLKQTITNLESVTQLLKDVLLQRFTTNIK